MVEVLLQLRSARFPLHQVQLESTPRLSTHGLNTALFDSIYQNSAYLSSLQHGMESEAREGICPAHQIEQTRLVLT
jgi:hypothetical protein